ncbi:MAG: hypothetical protein ACD_4C00296G0001, partial [uncultured bacterium (gcode 4)]
MVPQKIPTKSATIKHKKSSIFSPLSLIHWFTIVELIVIITIVAILWTISFLSYSWFTSNTRNSMRMTDMKTISSSLDLYLATSSKYPIPSNPSSIMYSWSLVWTQWTFWSSVLQAVSQINKIPLDPVYQTEYSYSLLNNNKEYQVSWIQENVSAYNNSNFKLKTIQQANAATISAQAIIKWNYNSLVAKVSSWSNIYIFALPTITLSDLSQTDLAQISSGSFVLDKEANLPNSYETTSLSLNWNSFYFQPQIIWSWSDIETLTNDSAQLSSFTTNLQNAYKNNANLQWLDLYETVINESTWSTLLANFTTNLIKQILNSSVTIITANIISWTWVTYSNCNPTTFSWYTIPSLNHSQTQAVTKTSIISNWNLNYSISATCTDWNLSYSEEIITTSCNSWYVSGGWNTCIADSCGNTVPVNATSNAISQTSAQNWTRNSTPWICTFDCNTNYTWNWSSCIANTQTFTCA